ncbi:uridine diphosphate-N-acetylglucosamine-binding protein YvcK [Saxibacter everestensis]|uniref:Putative gluconeogenesis factor n=1 Tax=Saxibacter everestensis TaxID=2909229 RepID=A0ABY8QXM1_9MICO|nr:uridine diphosphate-N-acetylglucosamine-binding protein YvcK [Brevibacteriaceae bacterium ZFBP1038]
MTGSTRSGYPVPRRSLSPKHDEAAGPKVVAFGGGHGLYAALSALRLITEKLTAVVTVADDGGSSGRLRQELGGLPPGDLRMALAALCDDSEWGRTWRDVIQHRFTSDGPLNGHSVGNLLISALWQLLQDHVDGLDWMARLLDAQGRVLPMSSVPLAIEADVAGLHPDRLTLVRGQSKLALTEGVVTQLRLDPADPPARAETLESVHAADVLNLGPGSWYTSVMPHLLVPELSEAIVGSSAVKCLTMNLISADGETSGMTVRGHLEALSHHAPKLRFDYILVDQKAAALEDDLGQASADIFDAELVRRPLAKRGRAQHDSLRLAAAYRDVFITAGVLSDDAW